MKDLDRLIERALEARDVFLPNRYQEPFVKAYQALTGEEVPEVTGRKLSASSNGKIFRWMRGRDIPYVVARIGLNNPKSQTIGFTGSEWCQEFDCKDYSWTRWAEVSEKKLDSIALIAPGGSDLERLRDILINGDGTRRGSVQVVTALPNLVDSELDGPRNNLVVEVTVGGCAESVAGALGYAAVDLVSSGVTIETNGFVVVRELKDSFPAMVTYNTERN